MQKKSVSLVLGSGGARGLAHIGVIRYLEESGYEIKSISGCSMGALIGGFSGIIEVQPSFSGSLQELDAVLAVPGQPFDKKSFTVELKKLRELLIKEKRIKQQGLPSNINPMV